MKTKLLISALAMGLYMTSGLAISQHATPPSPPPPAPTNSPESQRSAQNSDQRDSDRRKGKTKAAAEKLYPNATRTEPKLDLTSAKDQKVLNSGLDAVNDGDKAKAEQILQPLHGMSIVMQDAQEDRIPFAPDDPRSKRRVLNRGG